MAEKEKLIPPWKRELFAELGMVIDEQDEAFIAGVIAGYHDAGVALAKAALPNGKPVPTPEYIYQWAQGFASAYVVRLQLEERKKRAQDDGTTKNTARVDVRWDAT